MFYRTREITQALIFALLCQMGSVPSFASEVFRDRFQEPVYVNEVWDSTGRKRWPGSEMEEKTEYCSGTSIRWNAPVTNFDINLDGKPDLLLAISCYQPPYPEVDEKHNQGVIAAWRLFCSQSDGSHEDCTKEVFGSTEIMATAPSDPGGGNPYTHVMAEPKDLNGDGYPEIWYALNRDDGRPGFNFDNPEDLALLEEFCALSQPESDGQDCTRMAVQSMLVSQGDGTYKVVHTTWRANTQATAVLPNADGGYDLLAFNYGPFKAARLVGNSLIDVTDEYKSYRNIDIATQINPYIEFFDYQGKTLLVTSEVHQAIIDNPEKGTYSFSDANTQKQQGFSVWEWKAGVGFDLLDFFIPADNDKFSYKEARGDSYEIMPGAFVRGIPAYFPRWNFFEFVRLHPNEEPVLVALQESNTTFGEYFKAPPDPNAIYRYGVFEAGDYQHRISHLMAVEAFYLRDGKLVPREQSVIEGDVVWSLPGMRFKDLTGNGLMDMYGHTGGPDRGSIYLNNGRGTLRKVNLRTVVPDVEFLQEGISWNSGGAMTVRDLGKAPYLSLIYWVIGNGTGHGLTDPEDLARMKIGEFTILQAKEPITSVALESAEEFQTYLGNCVGAWPECDPY